MGELVSPKVFRKWQAVINNSSCVERVTEMRNKRNVDQLNLVTLEDHAQFSALHMEMAQIDLLTNFLLDINHADPLVSDSTPTNGGNDDVRA